VHRRVTRPVGLLALVLLAGTLPVSALPFEVPLDPAQSVLNFELCISGKCDTDSSSVTGTVTVALDSVDLPAQIALHDFDLHLARTLQFDISWGFFGAFHATLTAGGLHYALPGTVQGPVGIVDAAFLFPGVPVDMEGTLAYQATGVPCAALQVTGRPCNDTRDLANEGTQNSDWSGTITTANRTVTLATTIDSTSPLDPNYPDLGTVHVWGTVRGSVYVPRPLGDLNCDGAVNGQDIDGFVMALFDPAGYAAQYPTCDILNADMNADGVVNGQDIDGFVAVLFGG